MRPPIDSSGGPESSLISRPNTGGDVVRRTVLTLFAVLGLVIPFGFLTPTAAHAATLRCRTSQANVIDVYKAAGVPAELKLYYDAANGTNCAKMVHVGPAWGIRVNTGVLLMTCVSHRSGSVCGWPPPESGRDVDAYAYYAGPVVVPGRGRCVAVTGYIFWKGKHLGLQSPARDGRLLATHCG